MNVLSEMIRLGLNVEILPIPRSRREIMEEILKKDFDVFVSNGLKYILPSHSLLKGKIFINCHPSLLPKFKGTNSIREAFYLKAPMGATCHLMVAEVDDGPILGQVEFKADYNDLNDCYRKAFDAEGKAFLIAYKKEFKA